MSFVEAGKGARWPWCPPDPGSLEVKVENVLVQSKTDAPRRWWTNFGLEHDLCLYHAGFLDGVDGPRREGLGDGLTLIQIQVQKSKIRQSELV